MKRIIKGIFLFVVIALSLVFAYPLNTYALTEQTSYVSIDNTQNLKVYLSQVFHLGIILPLLLKHLD